MTLGNTMNSEDYRHVAAQEAAVARATHMRHGALLATIDFSEFGFVVRAGSSIPLTDARLRQCCFLFRSSHRDYEERLFRQS